MVVPATSDRVPISGRQRRHEEQDLLGSVQLMMSRGSRFSYAIGARSGQHKGLDGRAVTGFGLETIPMASVRQSFRVNKSAVFTGGVELAR